MTQLTERQAKQAQIDAWQDRHDIQAYKTVPMSEQTAQALYRDHVEALEMNANDDSGRAACLGITAPLNPTAVALTAIAQGMQADLLIVPNSIDIWFHDLPRKTFMSMADGLEKSIKVHEPLTNVSEGHASISSNFPVEQGAARIAMHYLCRDLSPEARQDYATHNAECVTA